MPAPPAPQVLCVFFEAYAASEAGRAQLAAVLRPAVQGALGLPGKRQAAPLVVKALQQLVAGGLAGDFGGGGGWWL